jgi:hypothetical protein
MIGLAGAPLASAADAGRPAVPVKLNVKLGLWEVATQANISGMPQVMPDEMMAKLTPEQRARMQAAMQASMADMAKPKMAKHCVTAEKLARGMDLNGRERQNCQRKIVTNSSSELQINEACTEADGTTVLDEHIQLAGSLLGAAEQMSGTVHFVKNSGGKTMTVDSNIKGQWLGASCGDIKDYQLEK